MWAMVRSYLAAAAIAAGGGLVASDAAAETVALIGTGNVGAALGQRLAQNGHQIVYGSRDPAAADVRALVATTGHGALAVAPADAAARSDIIVLAVPWSAVEEVVRGLGELDGKIIVDPTNPRVMAGDGFADYPIEDSNAERIARLAPGAHVVKAFNTLGSETMLDPKVANSPVTIPIVGDDRAAKARVATLAREIGLDAVDVGPLRHARIVEGLHYLRANALGGRINYHLPRDPARN